MGAGALLLSLLSFAACSTADDIGSGEAMQTEVKALTVVKGREYARCWFDVVGDSAQLSCTTTARGTDPLGAKARVVAATINAQAFQATSGDLDIEAGGTVVVGALPRSAFPVLLMLNAKLTKEGEGAVGAKKGFDVNNNVQIARPEDLPPAHPATLGQPYDLWPVAFIDTRGEWSSFAVNTPEYKRSTAPYTTFADANEMVLSPSFSSQECKGKTRWFVAPSSGPIATTLSGAPKRDVTIPGPGYYAVTEDDFRAATPAEIAVDFGGSPATSPTTPVTPPPPVEPVDATPTCGGANQSKCPDNSCDPGHRYDSGTCVACGGNGQTYCYVDPKGTDYSSGKKCSPGTRLDGTQCVTCGGEGQTYCYVDPNGTDYSTGKTCSAGLTVKNNVCAP
ncbi:MAG TPA: hypothetical protein VM925_00925 [Labilithrix sp.]|nr:hypothetical protein [Labilithrix sp.]